MNDQFLPSISIRMAAVLLAGVFLATAGLPVCAESRPLGNDKVSTTPRIGYLMSCKTRFDPNAPAAFGTGPWLSATSYDTANKPSVEGSVTWPSQISVTRQAENRIIRANSLPDHPTGTFPIAPSDPSYQYDRNPNHIGPQTILLTLPAEPELAASPSCVPMGMTGFALTGAAIYNAVDERGRDAPAYEIQDTCHGHPQHGAQYHYHDRSPCLQDTRSQPNGHSDLVGYALDGFGIFDIYGEGGKKLTTADLDACHGHTHEVIWDEKPKTIFHYHMTDEYPYSMGCFRGTPVATRTSGRRGPPGMGRRPPPFGGPPPPPPGL